MKKIFNVKLLLQEEQLKLEKIIAYIRLFIFCTFLIITVITDGIIEDEPYHNHIYLFLIITLLSLSLLFEVLLFGKKYYMNRIYAIVHNSLIPLLDVLIVSYVVLSVTMENSTCSAAEYDQAIMRFNYVYLLASSLFIIMNLLRFNVVSSAITGVSLSCIFFFLQFYFFRQVDKVDGFIIFEDKLYFVSTVFLMTVISILAARRIKTLLVKSKKQESLNRFLPDTLAREMMKSESSMLLQGERITATVLFSDIRSFTSLSETMKPEEVISFLNSYFEMMIDIVFKNGGTLDKLIGDGMMAVFGAFGDQKSDTNGANDAVAAAVSMISKLSHFNAQRRLQNLADINIGIGIHTGEMIIGGVGSDNRMDFTSIGDTVNTASRIEALTKEVAESILVSESTKNYLKDTYKTRDCGIYELKGKTNRIAVFSVLPD